MQTSHFANLRHLDASKCVSIALYTPRWAGSIRRYPALAPTRDMLRKYKDGSMTWQWYEFAYWDSRLVHRDAKQTVADLGDDAILLCYEKPGEHCHRHLVAGWLEQKLGISVPEWTEVPPLEAMLDDLAEDAMRQHREGKTIPLSQVAQGTEAT